MTGTRWVALATMTWALWQVPGLAQAEVYRCSVAGRTVYQDVPCEEVAPLKPAGAPMAAPVGTGSKPAPPSSDPAILQKQLLDAREQSARLRALYDREVQDAKEKAVTMSLDQQRQLTKVLHARWDPKLQAAGRREQELFDALRKLCPNAQAQQCSK